MRKTMHHRFTITRGEIYVECYCTDTILIAKRTNWLGIYLLIASKVEYNLNSGLQLLDILYIYIYIYMCIVQSYIHVYAIYIYI